MDIPQKTFNYLSDDDLAVLKKWIYANKRTLINRRTSLEPDEELPSTSGTMIATAPATGIPSITGTTLGQANCTLSAIVPVTDLTGTGRKIMAMTNPDGSPLVETVYNLYQTAVAASATIAIKQNKSGEWFCDNPARDATSGGTGGGCNCRACTGCVTVGGCPACGDSGAPYNWALTSTFFNGALGYSPAPTACFWFGAPFKVTGSFPGYIEYCSTSTTTTPPPNTTGTYQVIMIIGSVATLYVQWVSGADPWGLLSGNRIQYVSDDIINCNCEIRLNIDRPELFPNKSFECSICITPGTPVTGCCWSCFALDWPGMGADCDPVQTYPNGDSFFISDAVFTEALTDSGTALPAYQYNGSGGGDCYFLSSEIPGYGCFSVQTGGFANDYLPGLTAAWTAWMGFPWSGDTTGLCCDYFGSRGAFGNRDLTSGSLGDYLFHDGPDVFHPFGIDYGSSLVFSLVRKKGTKSAILTISGYSQWTQNENGTTTTGAPTTTTAGPTMTTTTPSPGTFPRHAHRFECDFIRVMTCDDFDCAGGTFENIVFDWRASYITADSNDPFLADGTQCIFCSELDDIPDSVEVYAITCPHGCPTTTTSTTTTTTSGGG